MSAKYFALLTNIGAARLANATALGSRLNITRMAVGDGGGVLPTPNPAQTKLINEKRRAALNTLSVDPKNPSQIIAEQVIPENDGGWWIREIGLFDDEGNLIAVANCPETYKPQLQEGSGRIQTVRMILIVSSTDAVTLKIDPAVVLATRSYVDDALAEHEKSRKHPDGTLAAKGFVQLSSATSSDSELLAATPKAVKAVNDNANGRVPSGRKVNGKALTVDIALGAGDVGAYTKAETDTRVVAATTAANNAATAATNANTNANGRVPSGRTVNGKALSADIALSAGDVGALPAAGTAVAATKLATARKIAGVAFDGTADIALTPESVGLVTQSSDIDNVAGRVLKYQNNGAGPFGLGSSGVLLGSSDIVVQLRSAKNGFYRCTVNTIRAPSSAPWNFLVQHWDANTVNVIAFSTTIGVGMQFITIRPDTDSGWYQLWGVNNLPNPMNTDTAQTVTGMKTFSETPRITRSNFPGVVMTCTNVSEGTVGREVSMLSDLGNVVFIARKGDGTDSEQRMVRVPMSASGTALVSGSNAVADSRGYYKTPNSTEVTPITASEMAGLPQLFPGAVAPTGWLKCNGQAFDKSLYPVLASRYPSGVLPDLRGEFVRGWDDGRGADAGRALLSAQSAFTPPIPQNGWGTNGVTPTTHDPIVTSGHLIVGSGTPEINETLESLSGAGHAMTVTGDTRPRNIAFNYIVRAA
ncbi:phage tail-collar fiber domain-containing protein [Pectobacterium actinidiae]|uniref:phage tail-collar fiber domain-containing protein n=1 Tax=Pectobacterium actinidiae TaxID=1507808 RepID=UPI00382E958B